MAINVDGARDLVPFNYGGTTPTGQVVPVNGVNAILLDPHLTAYNTNLVGAIQGTLNLANVSSAVNIAGNTSFVDIQVTAESLSADGTRHVVVNSAPVAADGTFTLYPLATSSNAPQTYDLVIHGKGIATTIVQGVTVIPGDPTSTTPVNIGTITPRVTAQSFRINMNTTVNQNTTPLLPAGTLVGFDQTLPGSSQVPYAIELRAIDPFNRAFAADQVAARQHRLRYLLLLRLDDQSEPQQPDRRRGRLWRGDHGALVRGWAVDRHRLGGRDPAVRKPQYDDNACNPAVSDLGFGRHGRRLNQRERDEHVRPGPAHRQP